MKDSIDDFFEQLRRMIEEGVRIQFSSGPVTYISTPAGSEDFYTDFVESEGEVVFTAELPGVKAENLRVDLNNKSVALRVDFGDRVYTKSFNTSSKLDYGSPNITFKNDVLEVRVQKN